MKKRFLLLLVFASFAQFSKSQNVVWPPDRIKELTADWTGERTSDGRPKVSDALMERLKAISMEEVWATLRQNGYENQFENFASTSENGWQIIHPEKEIGRAHV